MTNISSDVSHKKVLVIYKHSRYSYALQQAATDKKNSIFNKSDPVTKNLLEAHENNLKCIDHVTAHLQDLKINYALICRSDLDQTDLTNSFILTVGGDGTLLDTSHYCDDSSLLLGINSDPKSSVGALCAADSNNFREVIKEILQQILPAKPLNRLRIAIDNQPIKPLALNDILFCHHNPAAMSRFSLDFNQGHELHRGSGIWVATPQGSTGGIFSCGSMPLDLDDQNALFRVREPFWIEANLPKLIQGTIGPTDKLSIRCQMSDAAIFIDGPHKAKNIDMGQTITLTIDDRPLWLFDSKRLEDNRQKIIKRRLNIKHLL